MKLKRTKKEYGGGSRFEIFSSELFRVVLWKMSKGIRTTLTINSLFFNNDIHFDGEHRELNSDEKCFEQLTVKDLKRIIDAEKKQSFEEGKKSKIIEIRECLNLESYY